MGNAHGIEAEQIEQNFSPETAARVAALRADAAAVRAAASARDAQVMDYLVNEKTQAQWDELSAALVESVAEAE